MGKPTSVRIAAWIAAIMLGAIIATGLVLNDLSELRDERADLEQLLESTSAGWVEASEEFFRSPAATARLIDHSLSDTDGSVELGELLAAIELDDDIDAAYIGFPNGAFQFAARNDANGFRTRVIDGSGDGTALQQLDGGFNVLETSVDIDDVYDPTLRPWFEPISEGDDAHWSDPYEFASSGEAGITYSIGSRTATGELVAVVGIDVRLTALEDFLSKLDPGPNGVAALVNEQNQLIASSPDNDITLGPFSEFIADARAGMGNTARLDDGRTATAQPVGPNGEWVLVAVAQETDFLTAEHRTWVHVANYIAFLILGTIVGRGVGRPIVRWLNNIYRRANRDELTGLATRAAFTDHLGRAVNDSALPIAVAIIDLDRFKPVNDTWGHDQGDEALRRIAARIQRHTEDDGLHAARLGGDEFVITVTGSKAHRTEDLWDDLIHDLNRPVLLDGREIHIGASLGVTVSPPRSSRSIESMLRSADSALYRAKHAGGGCWRASDQTPITMGA